MISGTSQGAKNDILFLSSMRSCCKDKYGLFAHCQSTALTVRNGSVTCGHLIYMLTRVQKLPHDETCLGALLILLHHLHHYQNSARQQTETRSSVRSPSTLWLWEHRLMKSHVRVFVRARPCADTFAGFRYFRADTRRMYGDLQASLSLVQGFRLVQGAYRLVRKLLMAVAIPGRSPSNDNTKCVVQDTVGRQIYSCSAFRTFRCWHREQQLGISLVQG